MAHEPSALRGWYPDPLARHHQRWWTGQAWTHWIRDGASKGLDAGNPTDRLVGPAEPIGGWIAVGGAALALLGSFMPWATVRSVFGTINVSGTEGDGVITLALAALAAGFAIPLILRRSPPQQAFPIIVIVAAAICAVVGIADAANVSRVAEEETTNYVDVSVGFGLYIVIAGGIAAVVGGAIAFHKQRAFAQARPAQGVRSGGEVPKAELDEWRAANARSSVSWEDWRNARSSEV